MFPYINIKSKFFLGFSLLIFQNDFTQNPQLPQNQNQKSAIQYPERWGLRMGRRCAPQNPTKNHFGKS